MKAPETLSLHPTMANRSEVQFLTSRALQGSVSFGSSTDNNTSQNIQCYKALGQTPSTASTTFTITSTSPFFKDLHIPIGFIVLFVDQPAIIYGVSVSSWSNRSVSLACNMASVNYRLMLI